jgi:glutaredoxin
MKDLGQKLLGVLILALFGFVIFKETIGFGPSYASLRQVSNGISIADAENMHAELGGQRGQPPVVVFTTSWCGICRALEKGLNQLSLPFVAVDIEKDPSAMRYYQAVTRGKTTGVPVTVVGEQHFVGYQIREIVEAIVALPHSQKPSSNQSIEHTPA